MQPLRHYDRKSWEQFEDEIFDKWFPNGLFECLYRTPYAFDLEKRFIASATKPDFQFRIRGTNKSFWIECKERKLYNNDYAFMLAAPKDLYHVFLTTNKYDQ